MVVACSGRGVVFGAGFLLLFLLQSTEIWFGNRLAVSAVSYCVWLRVAVKSFWNTALLILSNLRECIMSGKKYKIGYTTGVFDMFHIGHLNILKRAKEQCEYLIVGVSTDETVESYKHKKPIIRFEERCAIVEAIRYVDKVVPQTSMNKMDAYKELKFDVLFHGSDWQGSSMYDQIIKEFSKVGVDVVFLPHTDGISSTLIREKANKA